MLWLSLSLKKPEKTSVVFGGEIVRNLDGPRLLKVLQKTMEGQAQALKFKTQGQKEREQREQAV